MTAALATAAAQWLVAPTAALASGPVNDDRAGATAVTTPYSADTSSAGATLEPGEPVCEGDGATIWYKFTLSGRGIITATVRTGTTNPDGSVSNDFAPAIALFYGTTPDMLTRIGCSSSAGNQLQIGGIQQPPGTYWVQIGGLGGTSGPLHVEITGDVTDPMTGSGAVVPSSDCTTTTLPSNDDGSTGLVPIGFPVSLYGRTYTSLYVNNNGNVTFDAPMVTYTPFGILTSTTPIIAPFFADVDTRTTSPVTYGYGQTVFEGHPAFCVDWVNVGYYNQHSDKLNSFQLLLVSRDDRAPGDFDIVFNYDRIEWETGDASLGSNGYGGYSARAGFSDGSGNADHAAELSGSGTNGAFLDSNSVTGLVHNRLNSVQNGRYVFSVSGGQPTCAGDIDCDHLSDATERYLGTDPANKDTDGDGLLDSWEAPDSLPGSGFVLPDGTHVKRDDVFGPYGPAQSADCTQAAAEDLRAPQQYLCLNHPPDPLHKDVYLEIDWQDCRIDGCPEILSMKKVAGVTVDDLHHAPNLAGLRDVVAAYDAAPVSNPWLGTGVNLNVTVDEAIPHTPNCLQSGASSQYLSFGSKHQRASGAAVLQAKAMAVRYVWSGHSGNQQTLPGQPNPCPNPGSFTFLKQGLGTAPLADYDWSPFGSVNIGGDTMVVTMGPVWNCPSVIGAKTVNAALNGNNGPCYRETDLSAGAGPLRVDPGIFPARVMANGTMTTLSSPIDRMLGEGEIDGGEQLWSRGLMHLLGHALGIADESVVGNDPAPAGRLQSTTHNPLTPLPPDSYTSWSGLSYAPHGGGGAKYVESTPNYTALANADPDRDGVPEGIDNCPGVYNPRQTNTDFGFLGQGTNIAEFGDACDPDIDGDGLSNPLPGVGETNAYVPSAMRAVLLRPGEHLATATTAGEDLYPYDTDNDGTDNLNDPDDDGDGIADAADNCAVTPNATQADRDADGTGDACDGDADGDGSANDLETSGGSDPLNPNTQPEYAGYGTCADGVDNDLDGQTDGNDAGCVDGDGDGIADADDRCPALASSIDTDADGDGIGDPCDTRVDVAGATPQYLTAGVTATTVSFTASAAGTYSVRVGGTDCSSGTEVATGSYTTGTTAEPTVPATALAEGDNTVRVCVTTSTGTASGTVAVAKHALPPTVSAPDLTAASDSGTSSTDDRTNATAPAFTGTATPGTTVALRQDNGFVGEVVAAEDGTWSITDPGPVAEGAHAYAATATDRFGNASTSAQLVITIDRTAPQTTVTSGPAEGSTVPSVSTFAFKSTEPGTAQCREDAGVFAACTSPWTTTATNGGPHTATLRAVDTAGNVESPGVTRSWQIETTAPTVTIYYPASGQTYDLGASLAANYWCADESGGSGLASCAGPVPTRSAFDTGTVGTKTFTVTATDLAGNTTVRSVTYYVVARTPTVTGLSPAGGVLAGGTTVVVTGTGFTADATVKFGNTAATSVTVNSASQITAVSPSSSSVGSVYVTVTTAAGTSATAPNAEFYYGKVPSVRSIKPTSSAWTQSVKMTIGGSDFVPGKTMVSFGGTVVTPSSVSATQITVYTPTCVTVGTIDVVVITPVGPSPTSSATKFTWTFYDPTLYC